MVGYHSQGIVLWPCEEFKDSVLHAWAEVSMRYGVGSQQGTSAAGKLKPV